MTNNPLNFNELEKAQFRSAVKRLNSNLDFARKNAPAYARALEERYSHLLNSSGHFSASLKQTPEAIEQLKELDEKKQVSWVSEKKQLDDAFGEDAIDELGGYDEAERFKIDVQENLQELILEYTYEDIDHDLKVEIKGLKGAEKRKLTYTELEKVVEKIKAKKESEGGGRSGFIPY